MRSAHGSCERVRQTVGACRAAFVVAALRPAPGPRRIGGRSLFSSSMPRPRPFNAGRLYAWTMRPGQARPSGGRWDVQPSVTRCLVRQDRLAASASRLARKPSSPSGRGFRPRLTALTKASSSSR